MAAPFAFVPLSRSLPYWPSEVIGMPALLDEVGVRDFDVDETAGLAVSGNLLFFRELSMDLPGLEGISLALLAESGATVLPFELEVVPAPELRLPSLSASLRMNTDLLRPVRLEGTEWVPDTEADGNRRPAEITLSGVGLAVDGDGDIDVTLPQGAPALSLGAVEIGETGVILVVTGLRPFLSAKQAPPAGAPPGFRGLALDSVEVHLPRDIDVPIVPTDLELEDLLIGTGGFSGTVRGTWSPAYDPGTRTFSGDGSGRLFSIPFALRSLELRFAQNTPIASAVSGELLLPFFEQPVAVDLALAADGDFSVALSATQPAGVTSQSGLVTFEKPGVLRCSADGLRLGVEDGVASVALSGTIEPLLPGLEWPALELRELSIDSEGNVRLEGGWLDLREAASLEFYGFRLEITKLGFGQTEDGGKWIGLSGGLKLLEGMPAGASVEGLRLIWYEDGQRAPYVTLNGVGVELSVEGVVSFKGAISFRELTVGAETVRRFDGEIRLALEAIGLEVDAVLVVGAASGPAGSYTFFAIYLGVELPVGIPLWATGLGLYGAAGLFALNMEPYKRADEEWYEGWYKRPDVGVTDLRDKWVNRGGSLALGAGVTIGTVADNGFTFAGRFLLVIVIPGPIILIEGKANLLKERATLSQDPLFRGLAVIDGRAGDMVIGLDAHYSYGAGEELVDLRGGVEAYYDFTDADAWHLYLGRREPRDKRIRADLFQLFEANAYLMIDARELALGAWVGYDDEWSFGPLSVTLEAWLESNAKVSFKPAHFYADAWLHGKVALAVFGFGLSLAADARLAADVFDPFHVVGDFSVRIELPWPLPDFGADVTLEWGPEPVPPPIPAALKEVAVEHLKSTVSWPLPRGQLLVPSHADGDGMLAPPPTAPAAQAAAPPPADVPIVPLDARPHVAFGRAVHDDALVGVNVQPPAPAWERIGDPERGEGPAQARFALAELALHRWSGSAWQLVARKGTTANPSGVPDLFGSWAPVPTLPSGGDPSPGQTKLWLWSKSPFDYVQNTGGEWTEWFEQSYPAYPCIPPAPEQVICFDTELEPGKTTIDLPGPASTVTIQVPGGEPAAVQTCVRLDELALGRYPNPLQAGGATVRVLDRRGTPYRASAVIEQRSDAGMVRGLDCGFLVEIALPCTAVSVTLTVTSLATTVVTEGVDEHGKRTATARTTVTRRRDRLILNGRTALVRLRCEQDETLLHELCWSCPGGGGVTATGLDGRGRRFGPASPADGTMVVKGTGIVQVVVEGGETAVTARVCATLEPTPDDVRVREEMAEHVWTQTERWSQESPLLEPHSQYRLTVATTVEVAGFDPDPSFNGVRAQTEYAYFRTQGAPGLAQLSRPIGLPADAEFDSGLDDLTRYVRQTVPPTVPAAGEPPRLPRPVYRAYDVGVEFNESYVESMYARGQRDLGLYLFDNNDQPVRDDRGRLLALTNRWGAVEGLTLRESDAAWIETVNAGSCAHVESSSIPHDRTLTSGHPGQLLAADTVHEGRLIPLLLHERFSGGAVGDVAIGPSGQLGGWTVRDEGGTGGPSRWEIGEEGAPPTRFIRQTSSIRGGPAAASDPVKPGTMLLRGDTEWTDYRLSAWVRTEGAGAIGLVVRRRDASSCYRFSMNPSAPYRRLVRITSAGHVVLAQDAVAIRTGSDQLVAVEVAGTRIRVTIDGEPLFDVTDAEVARGQVGLYAWADSTARFSDVRVDDLRASAPVPYRFAFTTSRFANFAHQLHSHDADAFVRRLAAGSSEALTVATATAAAVVPTTAPSEHEARVFEDLAAAVVGQAARQVPTRVEVTRVETAGQAAGLLVRCPEPIDWRRTSIEVLRAADAGPAPTPPGAVKIVAAALGGAGPNDESVELIVRDTVDPAGMRIEQRTFPGALVEPAGAPALAVRSFPSQPTTNQVLAGEAAWTDYRVRAVLRCDGAGSVGLLLRHVDGQNHLRLSIDRARNRRRLIRRLAGVETVLWEQSGSAMAGEPFELRAQVVASRVTGALGGTQLFDLVDGSLPAGRAGAFRSSATVGRFLALEVDPPASEAGALWLDRFDGGGTGDWTIVDQGARDGPSAWSVAEGTLRQTSNIHTPPASAGDPARPGTVAVAGSAGWGNVVLRVRLAAGAGGAIGVVFRWVDGANHYRFSMHRDAGYRRLVKQVGGAVETLWEDAAPYATGRTYELTVVAEGDRLRGYLDGVPLFSVRDGALATGQIGLYCHAEPQARFHQVQVHPAAAAAAQWLLDDQFGSAAPVGWGVVDEGDTGGPSDWRGVGGELCQTSSIAALAPDPASRGTLALQGELDWDDYRFSAQVRSPLAAVTGLVFRYRDHENHYRLVNDPVAGERRLVRVAEGTVSVVWQDTAPIAPGDAALVTIDCVGDRKTGWVGGRRLFDLVDDAGERAGRVGLLAAANPQARFADVRVGRPRWSGWYRFGAEERELAAATRVRIFSGNRAQGLAEEPLVEHRFRAGPGERGAPTLAAGGTDIRLTGRDGEVVHARPALAADAFASVAIGVLRKQDGSGVFVASSSGPLQPGTYRLRLTFRRDNRAADPESQVLSQAGETGAEEVVLDVPWDAQAI